MSLPRSGNSCLQLQWSVTEKRFHVFVTTFKKANGRRQEECQSSASRKSITSPLVFLRRFLLPACLVKRALMMNSSYPPFDSTSLARNVKPFDKIRKGDCESDDDDVLEFLGHYKTFTMPTKGNINSILSELKHQELIQRPRYVAQCWVPVLAELKQYPQFSSPTGLDDFFSAQMPSAKKTARMLQSQPVNEAESQCLDYLKKFIRSLDAPALGTLLKFTTGSDIQPERLEVSFTSMDGYLRRPIAHTCGLLLELPRTYRSYNELTEEFTSLLREKGAWGFNIV